MANLTAKLKIKKSWWFTPYAAYLFLRYGDKEIPMKKISRLMKGMKTSVVPV